MNLAQDVLGGCYINSNEVKANERHARIKEVLSYRLQISDVMVCLSLENR